MAASEYFRTLPKRDLVAGVFPESCHSSGRCELSYDPPDKGASRERHSPAD